MFRAWSPSVICTKTAMTVCSVAGDSGKFGKDYGCSSSPAADPGEHVVFGK